MAWTTQGSDPAEPGLERRGHLRGTAQRPERIIQTNWGGAPGHPVLPPTATAQYADELAFRLPDQSCGVPRFRIHRRYRRCPQRDGGRFFYFYTKSTGDQDPILYISGTGSATRSRSAGFDFAAACVPCATGPGSRVVADFRRIAPGPGGDGGRSAVAGSREGRTRSAFRSSRMPESTWPNWTRRSLNPGSSSGDPLRRMRRGSRDGSACHCATGREESLTSPHDFVRVTEPRSHGLRRHRR